MGHLTSHDLVAILWSLTVLAFMFTAGRFAIHWQNGKRIRWDDILNGVAATFLLAFASTYQIYGPLEYNQSLADLELLDDKFASDALNFRLAHKYNIMGTPLFWCVIYSVKASFLALYWLLFHFSLRFRIAWAMVIVYTSFAFGISFMWDFWHCGKPEWFLKDHCNRSPSHLHAMAITWCVLDIVGDLLLIALPLAMLWDLLARTAQKFELGIIFCLVFINIIVEILRTVYMIDENLARFPDQYLLWLYFQPTSAVIICALPCYRGLLLRGTPSSVPCLCERVGGRTSNPLTNVYTFSSGSSEFPGNSWQNGV